MAHLGGVCDLVHTQKDELSQSKHMGFTIYTKCKGNINLASYGQDHADVGAKGGNLFWGLNDPFGGLAHPDTFLTSLKPLAILVPCTQRDNVDLHTIFQGY